MKKIYSILLISVLLVTAMGCGEDYLERSPTNSIPDNELFQTIVGAETAINGVHRMTYYYYDDHDRFGQKAVDLAIDLMGEDLLQKERGYGWFVSWYQYIFSRNVNAGTLEWVWSYYYDIIDNVNIIIEHIDNAHDYDTYIDQAKDIKAQAYAYRAYCYWYLVQLFADRYDPAGSNGHLGVPLLTVATMEPQPRSTVAQVYEQMVKDIDESIKLFGESSRARRDKSHINLNTAQGIKARIALTMGEWAVAADMANKARQGYALTGDYMNGWSNYSDSEWIWGMQIIAEQQTSFASFFSHIDPLFEGYATFGSLKLGSTEIVDYMSETDQRKNLFQPEKYFSEAVLDSYFLYYNDDGTHNENFSNVGFKFSGYGAWDTDYLYMKSGEMYLIEAEALARLGQNSEAQEVIFELTSNRDPEAVKTTLTGEELIQHILMERRCDLWGDGFRLLDIKRLNIPLDRRDKGHNPAFWNNAGYYEAGSKYLTFLIPQQEINSNPQLAGQQNEL